jgi:hypothetical protein
MRRLGVRFRVRSLMAFAAVVALLTAWAKVFLSPVQPSDGIVWKTFQFGVMPPETTGQQVWPIANAGRVPLQVYCVCSGFGTTIHGIINGRDDLGNGCRLVIPPGGKADIIMEWRTHRANGPYKTYAHLGTNDPDTPTIGLSIEGLVEPTW